MRTHCSACDHHHHTVLSGTACLRLNFMTDVLYYAYVRSVQCAAIDKHARESQRASELVIIIIRSLCGPFKLILF